MLRMSHILSWLIMTVAISAWPSRHMLSKIMKQFPFDPYANLGSEKSYVSCASLAIPETSKRGCSNSDLGFEAWLDCQKQSSLYFILENIGGTSTSLNESEVSSGIVIASQSRENPDYFYTWVRDSALTIRSVIESLATSSTKTSALLKTIIESYIEVNYYLQRKPNKSGIFEDERRSALGEPKFRPNGDIFSEVWGRPQSDGPALRISTIARYLAYLQTSEESVENQFLGSPSEIYYNIVKPDLQYVIANLKSDSFDLWEEVNSLHFFNTLVQLKSIQDGIALAKSFEEAPSFVKNLESNFEALKSFVLDYSTGFKQREISHIVESPSLFQENIRSGLDAASLLASLHAHSMAPEPESEIPFDVDDSHILNTLIALVSDMKVRYPVNAKYTTDNQTGAGLGRYPEDLYDGYTTTEGNPWFIVTASASEVLYRLVYKLIKKKADIQATAETERFFSLFVNDGRNKDDQQGLSQRIEFGSEQYKQILQNIFAYSDTFMKVIRDHIDSGGHMSEQFNKYTGYMQGACDLTWSHSSFYNSVIWREKVKECLFSFEVAG